MSTDWRPNPAAASLVRAAAEQAATDAAEVVLLAAQANVPVDTGALKRSGKVTPDGLAAVVSFTDPIAIIVHEDMHAHHTNGKAKYLEQAMSAETAAALKAAGAALRSVIGD